MLKVIEMFAGIGSQTQALKNLGIEHEVIGISEIDKYSIKSYEAIHGPVNNFGDITKIEKLPYSNLWTYSFPCQDLSVAGKQAGIKEGTRSGLLLEVERLLEISERPKYLLLENVKNLVGKKNIDDFNRWLSRLEEMGYKNYWQVLNAKDYGIPQNRERVFVISIRKDLNQDYKFPEAFDNGLRLKDMLEEIVEEKYYIDKEKAEKLLLQLKDKNEEEYMKYSNTIAANYNKGIANDEIKKHRRQIIPCITPDILIKHQNGRRFKEDGEPMFTLTAQDKHGVLIREATKKGYAVAEVGDSINIEHPNSKTRRGRVGKAVAQTLTTSPQQVTLDSNYRIRKLTPKECWRLMGFKDEQFERAKEVNSDSQLYKQAGNSIVVNVLEEIFNNLFKR